MQILKMSWFVSELAEKNSFDVSNDESRVAQVFFNLLNVAQTQTMSDLILHNTTLRLSSK